MLFSKFTEMLLPFPLPSSVIGLVLLFVLLSAGIIKLGHVEAIGNILVDNVGLFFVPAGVGAIKSLGILREDPFVDLLVILLATIILLACSGFCTQLFLNAGKNKSKKKSGWETTGKEVE
ncbi:MAG: CidA/LrgA family protein [Turicibacter sp.]|nr:CidA/LrgA family protein [Turicibacter sp.]